MKPFARSACVIVLALLAVIAVVAIVERCERNVKPDERFAQVDFPPGEYKKLK